MRVILRKRADAHQTHQRARKLASITCAKFAVTQRQIAIAALLRSVDSDVERAIHRLDAILFVFELHRSEHRIRVILFVPRDCPQMPPGDMRRKD